MFELIVAAAAVIAALALSHAAGRRRKREGLAWVEAQPQNVARLYLRAAGEADGYWLHAEMQSGKKRMIAAPWELDATLGRLAARGLRLSADDHARLGASAVRDSDRRGEGRRAARRGAFGGAA
ncbi:MAG: hypothetical protein ROZ37_07405 [Aromatoleum sp.]|jgi:predicted outer membrane lipoprotein|uniref:hypothetical protein n=1 Tax=Aromatoleum sp. TaxID=2307007 RepID=UPI0028961F76|nr:hypothetical protein [Aromatoleum sp.]MDT3670145.1 hypothetical protein [Aromatoleum sp.]